MKTRYALRFKEQLRHLPFDIRRKFYKQVQYLTANLTHPSLRAKKYDEARGIWQARVDRSYRFYFTIEKDVYILTEIIRHKD